MMAGTLTRDYMTGTEIFLDGDWIRGSCVKAAQRSTAVWLVSLLLGGR